ncbi:MAG: CocE/NonD family hydrolase, partial [Gluconacetobacter diazotrophicus]|nr:CocE/NonD family hydrolase [Gluconacetobacter diazotrophicus]
MVAGGTAWGTAWAQATPGTVAPDGDKAAGDIPARFAAAEGSYDYDKRDVMIPMRDGVKLHAVIVVPHASRGAPMMLDRTPYSASNATKGVGPHAVDVVRTMDRDLIRHGYIVVHEDVRGKYGSGGDYVMNRPLAGPLNPTKVDHSTDTWDTIDWLVHHVSESNGRVGTYGISYDGFTTLMSLVHPHPALHAAVPMNPMV